jgi:hypothetical protein
MVRAVENRTFAYERTYSEIKRHASAGLDGPELLQRVAERLRRAVPFEAYCVTTLDPASNLMTHVINGGSVGEEDHTEYREVAPGRRTGDEGSTSPASSPSIAWEACSPTPPPPNACSPS